MSPSHAAFPCSLRLEEVDAPLVLPQILRLRATVGRRVSLAPDAAAWGDALDARAMHWGVFRDAELVAAARLFVGQASLDGLPEAALFQPLCADLRGPVALISHCVVDPRVRELRLEGALDAARIERARQLGLSAVLAMPRSPRRLAALTAQGFSGLAPGEDGRSALMLRLRQERTPVRLRAQSRR